MKNIKIAYILIVFLPLLLFLSCSKEENDNPADIDEGLVYSGGMVLVEAENAGFQMGSENGFADELPVHTVNFTYDFWMDTVEVTQGDYDDLMTVSYADYLSPTWQTTYGAGDDYPAYSVFWGDAALYCNARSRAEGLDSVYTYSSISGIPGSSCQLEDVVVDLTKNGFRLPTEAEWEYACRAGTTSDFYWGRDCDPYPASMMDSTEMGNFCVCTANRGNTEREMRITGLIQWERRKQTLTDYTICRGMFTNGAMIGTALTRPALKLIRPGRPADRGLACGVGVGGIMRFI